MDQTSHGTIIAPDGSARHLRAGDYQIEVRGRWRSPHSGGDYPAAWRVRVPAAQLDVLVQPTIPDQELHSNNVGGVTYWEGAVIVTAPPNAPAPERVTGRGYVEL
ncbi:MAG: carotenoid 1,2-hydratase, partial [Chloroflexota bacterium]